MMVRDVEFAEEVLVRRMSPEEERQVVTHVVTVADYGPERRAWVAEHCCGAVFDRSIPDPRYREKVLRLTGEDDEVVWVRGPSHWREMRLSRPDPWNEIAFELEGDAVAFGLYMREMIVARGGLGT